MDAIKAVVDVVEAHDALADTVETYESWFESLVGKTVTLAQESKKKTRFITTEIEEFAEGEGWLARDVESDEVFEVTFDDFVEGRAWVVRPPAPVERPKRHVSFVDEE